jgi:hypothetical protein
MISSATGGAPELRSNSPYLRPGARIPNPARTLAYEENIGRWAWACRREINDCFWIGEGVDPGATKALRGWHGKSWTYNSAFVDGHTATVKVYIEGTEDNEGYANHYRNEIVFPNDTNQQAYSRCIIVRGDGWQRDTLPADPIPTGVYRYYGSSGRTSYEGCVQSD